MRCPRCGEELEITKAVLWHCTGCNVFFSILQFNNANEAEPLLKVVNEK